MAEILSMFINVVLEKLVTAAVEQFTPSKEIHSELKKWERSLSQIRDLLDDASDKEVTNEAVKQWLIRLQHLAYDVDDILDTLATDAMHREFANESEPVSKVRKLLRTCFSRFLPSTSNSMDGELINITTKLQELVDEKNNLGLSVTLHSRSKNINRSNQTSLVNSKIIVGREDEKKELIRRLLSDEQCDENFSIVPIVGMGGMGKTTLARLLYDDKKVKDHFELKAWVCVSDEFDSFKISEVIFQSVAGKTEEFKDLNLLQVALKDLLKEKRFLLVLDDVWSDKIQDWETLVGPFYEGASGSKIIITTRKRELLRQLGHDQPYDLHKLPHDEALSLFSQHAGIKNFDSYPMLRPHAEGIVKKCDGLPLALKALGCLLRTKTNEEEWKELLNDEIWMLQDGGDIVPALRLSYQDLSACMKRLFAYCSLFPKDCVFEKEDLILLWMAEGFLHQPSTNKSMERLGGEYFEELLSRSFFQQVPNDESLFVMHDLINDLATYVAGDFFARLDIDVEKDAGKEAPKKHRHMSVVRETYICYKKFKAFEGAKSLRTFLVVPVVVRDSSKRFFLSSKVMVDLLPELPFLRVLCLTHLQIDEVPESVGKLKHLRYLNLSRSEITHLPEHVCNLLNLQTLIVFGCSKLTKLPNSFLKLKNLRHFDIRGTSLLKKMPLGIGELTNLHLSKIIIGGDSNFAITGLKNFKNFHREVSIHGLDKVQNTLQAKELNFSQKGFSKLKVEWSDVFDGSRNETLEKEVLDALKPHNEYLKDLDVVSYGGIDFPNWIRDPSFLRLTRVSITSCKKCLNIPPLGQLPSLKKLLIKDLDEMKVVGPQLLGTSPPTAFPSLEFLSFQDMPLWEEWSSSSDVVGGVFPCLQELTLDNCPNLAKVSLEALRSLRILKVKNCGDSVLRSLIRVASPVTKLSIVGISGLSDEVWRDVMGYLMAVEEVSIRKCNEIKYMWESEAEASKVFVNLRKLHVWDCSELVSLGEKVEENDNSGCNHLTSLKIMTLWSCKNLERFSCPDNIESLTILGCNSITCVSFPKGGCQKLKSLQIEACNQLSEKVLPITSTSMLEVARIRDWPNLKSVNELTKFIRLTELEIMHCWSIESLPADVLPTFTSLKRLTIMSCENMDVASFGLWPPNLGFLEIGGLKKPISQWGPQTFPTSLVYLWLWGGSGEEDDVTSGSQLSHMLPKSLTDLSLSNFEKLESVSKGLQHLTSLQHLGILNCPKIKDLPEELLPSLLSLWLRKCSDELKEKTSRRGSYCPLISYIPHVNIKTDDEW